MSGNVREWVLDWLAAEDQPVDTSAWQEIRDRERPGPDAGRMLKGGSFADDVSHLRLFSRDTHEPNSPGVNRGFRCVYQQPAAGDEP